MPLFLSSLDDAAVQAVKHIRKAIPKGVIAYIDEFDAAISDEVARSEAYDFKLYLIPKTSSASASDTSLEFVNLNNLTDEQRTTLDRALVIIRWR